MKFEIRRNLLLSLTVVSLVESSRVVSLAGSSRMVSLAGSSRMVSLAGSGRTVSLAGSGRMVSGIAGCCKHSTEPSYLWLDQEGWFRVYNGGEVHSTRRPYQALALA